MRIVARSLLSALALLALLFAISGPALADAQGKKALMILAPSDFEASEYSNTRRELEAGGMVCTVTSTRTGSLKSNKSLRATAELSLAEVRVEDYDAVVIIGGGGVKGSLWKNAEAHRVVQEAAAQDKVVAAICAGPGVLGYAGVLQGRKATCYPQSSSAIKDNGGEYTGNKVEVDGKLITGNGPKAATDFGKAIVAAF